jgi:hypothetical protein
MSLWTKERRDVKGEKKGEKPCLEQRKSSGPRHGLRAGADVQFPIDIEEVPFDRARAHEDFSGDLLIG